jgi:putative inorganic carbon (hco3(-)) transporter
MIIGDQVTANRARSEGPVMAALIAVMAVTTAALVASSAVFLVAALCLGLVVIAVLRFDWFVYVQIFCLPWYATLGMNIRPRNISLVMHFILLAGVFIVRKQKGQSVQQWILGGRTRKGVLIFTGVAAISLLTSALGPHRDALLSLEQLLSYVAVFFGLAGWIETREQIEKIIRVLLWSTMVVALFGFYQVYAQGYSAFYYHLYPFQEDLEEWSGRIVSFLFHFNSLAGYLNLVLPFSLACMVLAKDRRTRILALICHTLAVAALFFTGSRGGLIAYGGMLLVSLLFLRRRQVALSRVLLASALAATIVLSLPRESAPSRIQEADEYTVVTRLALWAAAGSMFVQNPILGVGYGNYRALYNDYLPGFTPNQLDAHNLYLQFLSEMGIIGFLAFCLLAWSFARMAVRLARSGDPFYRLLGIGVGGALAATLIHGMVDYLFNVSPQFGALFWLVMALGLAAFEQIERTEANSRVSRQL